MKDLLFSTLKGYKKEYLPKDIFFGDYYGCGVHSYFNGICTDCGTSCSIWTIWFGVPDSVLCIIFNVQAVYLWGGCGTGSDCWGSTCVAWNRKTEVKRQYSMCL